MNCFVINNTNQSRHRYTLERFISKHLLDKYKDEEVVIKNDLFCYVEVPDLDVDLQFLRIAFGNFREITINKFGVHIKYE